MGSEPYVVELSSDDDDEDAALHPCQNVSELVDVDDDVIIIDKPADLVKRVRDKRVSVDFDIEDEECRILEGDPTVATTTTATTACDTDDLVMTGETGPVACRDFPHARHLCVHCPFRSTLHVMYCSQCHCYVCDEQAPCCQWGDGYHGGDHCHASDKDVKWKTLRKLKQRLCRCKTCSASHTRPSAPMMAAINSSGTLPTSQRSPKQSAPVGRASILPGGLDMCGSHSQEVVNSTAPSSLPTPLHSAFASPTTKQPYRQTPLGPRPLHMGLQAAAPCSERLKSLVIKLPKRPRPKASHLGVKLIRPPRILPQAAMASPLCLYNPSIIAAGRSMCGRVRITSPTTASFSGLPCPTLLYPSCSPAPNLPMSDEFHHIMPCVGVEGSAAKAGSRTLGPLIPNSQSHTGTAQVDRQNSITNRAPVHSSHQAASTPHSIPSAISSSGRVDQHVHNDLDSPLPKNQVMPMSNGGNLDELVGPPQEWAASFEDFQCGTEGLTRSATGGQEGAVSLSDVLAQFDADLWTDFPD